MSAENLAKVADLVVAQQRKADGAPPTDPDAWPEPILPGTMRVPEIPSDLLPEPLASMARAVARSTQTPPAMAVIVALTVVAAAVQRRFEVAPYGDDDYVEPLSIWGLVVLGSGNRKTAVLGALTDVLVRWEKQARDRSRSEIAKAEAARDVIAKRIEKLKNDAGREDDQKRRALLQDEIQRERESMPREVFAPRLFSGDVTAERLQQLLVEQNERMAVVSDEGGIFQVMAGAYSGGIASLDVFLQGHSGAPMRVDRAGRMAHLDRPALSFGLALQPGILQDAGKSRRFRDSGLMARFLYTVPMSNVGKRDVRERILLDQHVRAAWDHCITRLLDNMQGPIGKPRVIPFDNAARELWLDLCAEIERDQGEGGRLAHINDWSSKLPGAAARIAGLMALAEGGTELDHVGVESVRRAVQLARLLIPHAEAAFRLMGAADAEGDALHLLAWIRRNGLRYFARREAHRALESRFRTLDRMMPAVRQLQGWFILSNEYQEREHAAGRASVVYYVNPQIFVDSSKTAP
jgi:putative DNA primase/helicase